MPNFPLVAGPTATIAVERAGFSSPNLADAIMTSIVELITGPSVQLDLDVADRAALFSAVATCWPNQPALTPTSAAQFLMARESLGSTGLGKGVAIPHARCKGLTAPLGAFIRTRKAIEFDAPDGLPVDCFVFMLVPDNAAQAHLDLLAQVATALSREHVRETLRSAKTADEVTNALKPAPASPIRPTHGGH